ncbi:hypothetical protein [Streptomyces endophyticus]|uniref:Uncharacterized protein n=1 Tax=Streptomyces endophyticus TaxID=714166 RepID=A0ABU6F3S6_9ACTN|nr:hypothetical protein [Streptomyces endophyticus]MEB8338648.1 hypothetical protein [Streptomyces endophyticus]
MQYVRGPVRGVLVVVALLMALLMAGAPLAHARPTHPGSGMDVPDLAVVIAPGAAAGPSVALHDEDRNFARLERLTTGFDTVTERVPQAWQEGHFPPVVATVVWGLTGVAGWPQTHRAPGTDTAIERQDQLIVAKDGTPWIRTDPMVDVNDDDLRWHHASPTLVDQLTRAGVFPTTEPADRNPIWWALAGLAVGLAASALVWRIRVRPRIPREPRGPRQQLVDL